MYVSILRSKTNKHGYVDYYNDDGDRVCPHCDSTVPENHGQNMVCTSCNQKSATQETAMLGVA